MDEDQVGQIAMFTLFGAMAFMMAVVGAVLLARRKSRATPVHASTREARREFLLRQWLGLAERYKASFETDRLRFTRDGLRVDLAFVETRVGDGFLLKTRLAITGDLVPIGLSPERVNQSDDLRTGDSNFDGLARIAGDPTLALVALGPEARRRLGPALMKGWLVELSTRGTALVFEQSGELLDGMGALIDEGLSLAPLLARPAELHTAWLARLQSEPLAAGRLALASHPPADLLDSETHLAPLTSHPEPAVRLALASRLRHPALWATLAETTLLELYQPSQHPSQTTSALALTALSQRASVAVVPQLRAWARSYPMQAQALNDAILAIQSRASGARGDLALTDSPEAGALSLSPPDAPPGPKP